MFSVAPNIVLAPNMTQNAERKHRTQNTNTAHIRLLLHVLILKDRVAHMHSVVESGPPLLYSLMAPEIYYSFSK